MATMRRAADHLNLVLLARQRGALHRQIYERIRGAILSGELRAGARLPSARSLASQLTVARGTVETAYQILAAEGYVAGRGAAGTFVERTLVHPSAVRRRSGPAEAALPARSPEVRPREPSLFFRMGLPALDAFPRKLWSRLTARSARAATSYDLGRLEPAGLESLRRRIALYLRVARGVACSPEQVFVTTGYLGALALVAQTLLRPGDKVWVEDPGYFLARRALSLAGAELVSAPVDGNGLDVAAARRRAARARLAVVTPCHQFPLGITLPIARRLALLDWASETSAWIIEDDYDSEFRYRGRPLPALKSIDTRERVLYVGTFSKVLFPALRVGYLVVPDALTKRFAVACAALHPAPPALVQTVVTAFIEDGHFARHIRKMRQLYGARRDSLADALRRECGERLSVEVPAGGMHLIARLPPGTSDIEIARRAGERDLWPVALSGSAVRRSGTPGLLIGFANVPADAAPAAARALRTVLNR
jgi:GntR family transcriptional regulator/MocR family aminotransferase